MEATGKALPCARRQEEKALGVPGLAWAGMGRAGLGREQPRRSAGARLADRDLPTVFNRALLLGDR